MKASFTNFTNLVISMTFCLGLTACNKEDFYQKEFLDNPFQSEPTNTGTVNGGTQGGFDSGVNGGTGGGTDGSVTAGSSSGGVDGSTSSGSTTGGGVNGSTSSGSTTGGVDGSTSSGSTNGGGNQGTTDSEIKLETFRQSANQSKKLDIVWVIDNSRSMEDEQDDLGSNFSAFIDEFITKDVDFKMAITTTDTRTFARKGQMVAGSSTKLNSEKAKLNEAQFKDDFKALVKVGISGSGAEKGLEASEGFMQKYAATFLRPDAYLAVVILSDEEDQSPKSVRQYTDFLKTYKSEAGLVKVYTIADLYKVTSGNTAGAERYIEASKQTAGVVSNIKSDFYQSLTTMGDSLIKLLDSFALAGDPVVNSLRVVVNGVDSLNYSFDATTRSIKFDPAHLPPVGAEVKVYYNSK